MTAPATRPAWDLAPGAARHRTPAELVAAASHTPLPFIRSFDQLGPEDFLETFEIEPIWCDGCRLPVEACCCPEADEFDDVDLIGGGLAETLL